MGFAAVAAIGAGLTIYEACEVYDVYQSKGAEAALKAAGITAVTYVAGGAIGKVGAVGLRAASKTATAQKVFKAGGNYYTSAESAFKAYQQISPNLTIVVNKMAAAGKKVGKAYDYVDGKARVLGEAIASTSNNVALSAKKLFGFGSKVKPSKQAMTDAEIAASKLNSKGVFREVLGPNDIPAGSKIEYIAPGRVKFDGVEFRAVRNLRHLSDEQLNNMARRGISALDKNNKPLIGHHHKQMYHRENGAFIVEMPNSKHSMANKKQHPLGNNGGLGSNTSERQDWNKLRIKFNKARAKAEIQRRTK